MRALDILEPLQKTYDQVFSQVSSLRTTFEDSEYSLTTEVLKRMHRNVFDLGFKALKQRVKEVLSSFEPYLVLDHFRWVTILPEHLLAPIIRQPRWFDTVTHPKDLKIQTQARDIHTLA